MRVFVQRKMLSRVDIARPSRITTCNCRYQPSWGTAFGLFTRSRPVPAHPPPRSIGRRGGGLHRSRVWYSFTAPFIVSYKAHFGTTPRVQVCQTLGLSDTTHTIPHTHTAHVRESENMAPNGPQTWHHGDDIAQSWRTRLPEPLTSISCSSESTFTGVVCSSEASRTSAMSATVAS